MTDDRKEMGAWIDWAGGECPVPTNQLVDLRFARAPSGRAWGDRYRADPLNWEWQHGKAPLDIIAYREVTP